MSIIKYNPFAPAKGFGNWVDDFFNRNIGDFIGADFTLSQPSVNVIETPDSYRMEFAAPGLEKGDFKVNVDKGFLTVSAAKEEKKEEIKEGKYTRREFNYTSFSRSFQLPETVKADDIKATYEKGVLLVVVPRKEVVKPEDVRTIEIA
ncbi:MAG: Hsp20/alpha crystallin family protein [Saprospiraceae bacterium]|nr:Hsp20/alpha crystallin family protein [Saprospiraceae bacterium]